MQVQPFSAKQLHDREADGVRPPWHTHREDAMRAGRRGGARAGHSRRRNRKPRARTGARSLRYPSAPLRSPAGDSRFPRRHAVHQGPWEFGLFPCRDYARDQSVASKTSLTSPDGSQPRLTVASREAGLVIPMPRRPHAS
jgi:hypothetical protein